MRQVTYFFSVGFPHMFDRLQSQAQASALAVAALSKGHRLKMSQVEDTSWQKLTAALGCQLQDFLVEHLKSADAKLWDVLSPTLSLISW